MLITAWVFTLGVKNNPVSERFSVIECNQAITSVKLWFEIG